MIDPTYVTQATAWLAVWTAAGALARQHIAERDKRARDRATASRKAPTR